MNPERGFEPPSFVFRGGATPKVSHSCHALQGKTTSFLCVSLCGGLRTGAARALYVKFIVVLNDVQVHLDLHPSIGGDWIAIQERLSLHGVDIDARKPVEAFAGRWRVPPAEID